MFKSLGLYKRVDMELKEEKFPMLNRSRIIRRWVFVDLQLSRFLQKGEEESQCG